MKLILIMFDKIKVTPILWQICDDIYHKKIRLVDGKNKMYQEYNMNPSAFADYFYTYKKMLNGELHQRTIQPEIRQYMLEQIKAKYGLERLRTALDAFMMHIRYYEKIQQTTVRKDRALYEKYAKELAANDEGEQEELLSIVRKEKREDIINELKSLKATDPEQIIIQSKAYLRDNKTVAQLKALRNYTCQICGTRILKADGTYYVEAAHITPKAQKGPELPDNILILCPNHHKEYDYGHLEIIERDKEHIHFRLNGKDYDISLEIE